MEIVRNDLAREAPIRVLPTFLEAMIIQTSVYIYIYIYVILKAGKRFEPPRRFGGASMNRRRSQRRAILWAVMKPSRFGGTPNLPTNIVDFRELDSSIMLITRGGILMSIGDFSESLSRAMLVWTMLVGGFGSTNTNHHALPPALERACKNDCAPWFQRWSTNPQSLLRALLCFDAETIVRKHLCKLSCLS